eukprot:TRINITY_DN42216_c0_g1_i1.p1 TRINITY_DN42216_c0_g1~~TRINITY_DN42216_c0_g1_i1.p1  ORF type:complete len:1024 (-),score=167.95 TRINITY_DN42216_c0_g1_i1:276-3347(-)
MKLLLDGQLKDEAEVDEEQGRHRPCEVEDSLASAFEARLLMYADRPCLGWRSDDGYEWISYGKFYQRSRQVSKALQSRLPAGSLIGIIGSNSLDWFTADFACLWAGMGTVPLSEVWDIATMKMVVQKCELGAVFCDEEYLPRIETIEMPLWKVVMQRSSDGAQDGGSPVSEEATDTLEDLVRGSWPEAPTVAKSPQAIHTILHTSGTTGLPKGVVYTDNLWLKNMVEYPGLNVGYSYMPLAYITDRHTVCTNIWNGGRVGIRSPGSTDEIFKDVQYVRPTVMKGVPAFFERVKSAASLVHDSTLNILGGRCKLLICGAGALDESTAEWFRTCKPEGEAVKFLEMYGGTECGNIAVNRQLSPRIQYKLLPHDGLPDGYGELVVKTGDAMFAEYYKDPERTQAAFTEDGYYKIGDLVHIEDGRIDVIGRAKTSVKLGNGRWVFPESLEDLYRTRLNDAGVRYVFVHGDSHCDFLVAVVDAASGANVERLLSRMHEIAAASGKAAHEHISGVLLAAEPFSREAGTLNGTDKLDRKNLLKQYKADIDSELQRLAMQAAHAQLDGLDTSKNFTSQGGTSLQASRIAKLYLELGIPLSRVSKLLLSDQPVSVVKSAMAQFDPFTDAQDLSEALEAQVAAPDNDGPACVLLTGATGFVGRFVLVELLNKGYTVVCLVRANSDDAAKKRLKGALVEAGRWQDSWWPKLNVCTASMQNLAESSALKAWRVTNVIHGAAVVHLSGDYDFHRSANVVGTWHMIRFCRRVGARLVYLSTTDTYRSREEADACNAGPSDEMMADKKHGYAVSKAVGERLVAAAIEKGLSACTVRLGMVGGDTVTGFCNTTDFSMRMIIGFSHTESFPQTEDKHTMVHALPVDTTAAAVVDALESSVIGAANIVSGAPVLKMAELREQLIAADKRIFHSLPLLPFPEWIQKAKAEAMLSAWPVIGWAETHEEFPVFNTRLPTLQAASWARAETLEAMKRGVTAECLKKMVAYTFVGGAHRARGINHFRNTARALGRLSLSAKRAACH